MVEPEERISRYDSLSALFDSRATQQNRMRNHPLKWLIPSLMLATGVTTCSEDRHSVLCDFEQPGSKPMASTTSPA